MAHWCKIRVVFDEPLPEATLAAVEEVCHDKDYDFPRGCLRGSSEWHDYRSPMGGADFLHVVLLEHGASGVYWLTDRGDERFGDPEPRDSDAVVFRPGVDPHSLQKDAAAKSRHEAIQRAAERYVKVTRAFSVPSSPIVWEAFSEMGLWCPEGDRPAVEEAVKALVYS
jgi:mannosyltransferase OCH1-like enzyme